MSKNTAGFVLLGIISISGLGLGGYSTYLTLISTQLAEKQELKLIGLWEEFDYNTDFPPYTALSYWLLELRDIKIMNSDYIAISNNNTRLTLLKLGWYRIQLTMILSSIDASQNYWINILKNGGVKFILLYHETSATPESDYLTLDASAFVHSNGSEYFEIMGDSFGDPFFPGGSQIYNQLTIECAS